MKEKLHPFQLAVLIYMIQSGVTLFSIPRLSAETFGTNGWIGLLFIYALVVINIVLIWLVYKWGKGQSIFTLMERILPKWLLRGFYISIAVVFTLLATLVTQKYILLLKMLFFGNTPTIVFVSMFFIMSYLMLRGCIYEIGKSTVILFFITIWTMGLLAVHITEFSFDRMTPFLMKGEKDLLLGGSNIFSAFLGYELSIFLIPHVQKGFFKGVFFGNLITTTIYVTVSFVCYGFFSYTYLIQDLYPVITLIEYVRFPFVERVENLIFALFALKVLVTVVMYLWASRELIQESFPRVRRNFLSVFILTTGLLLSFIPDIIREVDQWLQWLSWLDTGIAFGLPVILIFLIGIQRMKEKKVSL